MESRRRQGRVCFGELGTVLALVLALDGGTHAAVFHSSQVRPMLFWLFLGGFVWVIGDLLQQFAVKYLGIGRGIPLSNTNQLWGLAWGALVFGELAGQGLTAQLLVIGGSLIMIGGAVAISFAEAAEAEHASGRQAIQRECNRYGLDERRVVASLEGADPLAADRPGRRWWELVVVALAAGVFWWLAAGAERQPVHVNLYWMALLISGSIILLVFSGVL